MSVPGPIALGVSIAGLDPGAGHPWAGGPRAAVAWAGAAGFAAVQLDGAMAGVRARELDRSGRRELAALVRRAGLALSGIDLWVPAPHFEDPARVERALEAAEGAITLAADLARLVGHPSGAVVALTLPGGGEPVARLARAAERHGVAIADCSLRDPPQEAGRVRDPEVGIGIEPGALLLRGLDPAKAATTAGPRLVQARLSDAGELGRVPVGSGRLDAPAYLAALAGAGYARPVVLDLRGLSEQTGAVQAARSSWPGP